MPFGSEKSRLEKLGAAFFVWPFFKKKPDEKPSVRLVFKKNYF